jgi:hypothetical protein
LFTLWSVSKDPIFAKDVVKLPRFRFRQYDTLPTHYENGNGYERPEIHYVMPEPLNGWRWGMGIALDFILLALVVVHTLILLSAGASFLRIVFIVYWVYHSDELALMSGRHIWL